MLDTLLPIVRFLRATQFLKAELPINVTPLPMLEDSKLLQSQYLQPVITQYFASNKSEIWS